MTEYQVLELISLYRSEGAQHVMHFVSVLFAYVIAAYFTGSKLSRFQTTAITVLYALFSPGPIGGVYEASNGVRDLHTLYGAGIPVSTSSSGVIGFMPELAAATLIIGWIISLAFMYQIRRTQSSASAQKITMAN